MKKNIFVAILLAFVFVLTACGGEQGSGTGEQESGTNDDQKRIAILTPFLSSVTTGQMVDELERQSEERGWSANVVDTDGDIGQLASRMEDVIASQVDAIVLVSTDPNQLEAQIKQADNQDIPVFGSDASYIEGMAMNATSDNTEMSKMITEYLFEEMGHEGNLVVLTHRPHPGVLKRSELLDEMLEEHTDIHVVIEREVQVPGPIESARQQMENLLLAKKEEGDITAVWAGWDEPAIGAAQAIQADGREDIIVTGIDGTSQAIEMIQEDTPLVATVQQNFVGMAEIVVEQMARVFAGDEVEDTEIYAPATLITPDNAADY